MEIFVILKETKELHGCCRVGDYFLVNMKNALGKIATLCRNWREGEMDLLKLSKFQLQLRALISEVHHLKVSTHHLLSHTPIRSLISPHCIRREINPPPNSSNFWFRFELKHMHTHTFLFYLLK